MQAIKTFLLFFYFLTLGINSYAFESEEDSFESEFDPLEMIMHHISDSHEWHIISLKTKEGEHKSITLPLPVIIRYEGNWHFFMSSAFDHGQKAVRKGDYYFSLYHEDIYLTDKEGTITFDNNHRILNDKPLDLSVTRNVASMWMSVMLLFFIASVTGLVTGLMSASTEQKKYKRMSIAGIIMSGLWLFLLLVVGAIV